MPPCYSPDSLVPVRFATCDPGLTGTGLALFHHGKLVNVKNIALAEKDWSERVNQISGYLTNYLRAWSVQAFYYELPAFMAAAAGNRSGDMVKLAIIAGAIHGAVNTLDPEIDIYPLPISTWKGNAPKSVMHPRILKAMDTKGTTFTGHELDAIGMGLYILKKIK
jgi:hypothetical protein